jgi:hypothetical protein
VAVVRDFVASEAQRAAADRPPAAGSTPHPPIFHLHVPRTAGRTFHGCLLAAAVPSTDRCPRAYGPGGGDAAAGTACGLLASHDDASLLAALPASTLVAVQVRHPLDRVLSSYEFATESAALAAGGAVKARPAHRPRGDRGGALGPPTPVAAVWPWSHLVPWLKGLMEEAAGVCAAGGGGQARCAAEPATLPHFPPPLTLAEFVAAPITADLVHNGATLQVLGATNASRAPGAAAVRACVSSDPSAAAAAADAAADRLRAWAAAGGHVGVSDRLDESVEAAAAAFGWSLAAPVPAKAAANASSSSRPSHPPRSLGRAYRDCEARTRDRSARRRARAAGVLGGAPPLGADGRAAVPPGVRDAILAANVADVALHAVAGDLLDAARRGGGERLPPRARARVERSEL